MKFTVTFKDPDGPYDSIEEAARESLAAVDGLSEEERDELIETRAKGLREQTRKWFKYGEYVNIEIDTEAGTATVLPAS
jgi:hypothetical protein